VLIALALQLTEYRVRLEQKTNALVIAQQRLFESKQMLQSQHVQAADPQIRKSYIQKPKVDRVSQRTDGGATKSDRAAAAPKAPSPLSASPLSLSRE
jgi:hypothetical protein